MIASPAFTWCSGAVLCCTRTPSVFQSSQQHEATRWARSAPACFSKMTFVPTHPQRCSIEHTIIQQYRNRKNQVFLFSPMNPNQEKDFQVVCVPLTQQHDSHSHRSFKYFMAMFGDGGTFEGFPLLYMYERSGGAVVSAAA